jgi:hypothetical protein
MLWWLLLLGTAAVACAPRMHVEPSWQRKEREKGENCRGRGARWRRRPYGKIGSAGEVVN